MPPVLALLLTAAVAGTHDPPFVAAARERQAKAKAFEVTLTVRKEWIGVQPVGTKVRKDFEGVETVKLAVDGERFWYEVDGQRLTGMGNGLTRSHAESSFDGSQIYTRFGSVRVNGPQAGELEYHYGVSLPNESSVWNEPVLVPLRWVYRGTESRSRPNKNTPQVSWHELTRATGREEVIGGTRCLEVERVSTLDWIQSIRPLWLDARDFLPVRIGDTTIEYAPHPTLGRAPTRWTITPAVTHGQMPTRTTVTVDSIELRDAIPDERFVIRFPVGSRVLRVVQNRSEELVVAVDGSLVPDIKELPAPPAPEPPTRSLQHSLWVVGGVVAVFVALVVLLKRLARNRTDDSPDSGDSPRLLT